MKQFYIKFNFTFVVIVLFSLGAFSQNSSSLWTKTTPTKMSTLELVLRKSEPRESTYYQLDLNALKTLLQNAPQRGDINNISNVIIDFPSVDSKMESFRVMEASVMHTELQAKFPEIRSYIGQSIQNPSRLIRFSVTPQGLHTMLLSSDIGTQFIDPYTKSGNFYILYAKKDLMSLNESFICEVIDEVESTERTIDLDGARNANDGVLRRYDLALGCSAEYTNFHGGTVPQALAAMVVSVTRVTGVFERDLSIRLSLVPNNNLLISTNANQIFGNTTAVINTSTGTINGIIGSNNYDIGHVFTTGAGGMAGKGVVCVANQKGMGVTGINAPIGDAFDIDFVAHEIGHQFGGDHTFNGSTGYCSGSNRSATSAYEPGSGTTIMAYAGTCAPQNVANSSQDYFHRRSIVQIWNNISAGPASACPTTTSTGNAAPTAEAGSSYLIPLLTPYKLTGSSTDANGTASHTYTWEQYDLGPAGVPTTTTTTGPMVRSFKGTTNPVRYIPRLQDVLVNGGTSTTWEVLAGVARVHNFELTVRDNTANGGQTASDNMTVTTVAGTGPFTVTSQNSNVTWQAGSTQTVTWNVSSTNLAPINAENVNIRLSTNGGSTFPIVLASGVPNNGAHNITVPNNVTNQARIMVEGAGNIFYNVNSSNFQIVTTYFFMDFASTSATVCQPDNAVYNFTYNTFDGFSETTTFSTTGVPAGANVEFLPGTASANGTPVTMTISNTIAVTPGSYAITVVGTAASTTKTTNLTLSIFSTSLTASTLIAPANGSTGVSITPTLTWSANPAAQTYLVQIATDANFTNIINSATVTTPSYVLSLASNTLYYWRVTSTNACATSPASSVFSFTTLTVECNAYPSATNLGLAIPDGTGTTSPVNGPPITHTINITDTGSIVSMTVNVDVTHTYVSDLLVRITHPDGVTSANLWSGNCGNNDNFDITFSDTGGVIVCASPTIGTYLPAEPLSVFNGLDPAGNWEILIADFFAQDTGTLNDWTLNICYEPTLNVEENEISEFSIFPNPNSGEFTIKLNSFSTSKIKVEVYDIQGRAVFNNSYLNNSNFNQIINLNNVQAGMYLVKVSDGERQTTKKIIVK